MPEQFFVSPLPSRLMACPFLVGMDSHLLRAFELLRRQSAWRIDQRELFANLLIFASGEFGKLALVEGGVIPKLAVEAGEEIRFCFERANNFMSMDHARLCCFSSLCFFTFSTIMTRSVKPSNESS